MIGGIQGNGEIDRSRHVGGKAIDEISNQILSRANSTIQYFVVLELLNFNKINIHQSIQHYPWRHKLTFKIKAILHHKGVNQESSSITLSDSEKIGSRFFGPSPF
jgi:hypothetical protein